MSQTDLIHLKLTDYILESHPGLVSFLSPSPGIQLLLKPRDVAVGREHVQSKSWSGEQKKTVSSRTVKLQQSEDEQRRRRV